MISSDIVQTNVILVNRLFNMRSAYLKYHDSETLFVSISIFWIRRSKNSYTESWSTEGRTAIDTNEGKMTLINCGYTHQTSCDTTQSDADII